MGDLKKEFVPYQEALELKELGFAKPCFGFHSKIYGLMLTNTGSKSSLFESAGECLAPTYSQAFRFFREEYDLFSSCDISNFADKTYGYVINSLNSPYYLDNVHSLKSIEEAELACLRHLIEIGAQEWFNRQLDKDKK